MEGDPSSDAQAGPSGPFIERPLGERLFEVADGIWRIPLPTGYPAGDVNLYWFDGSDPILVDTGVKGDRSYSLLSEALARGGRRIEDVRTLLLTHSHVDHAANAWRIREDSGCAVMIRRRAVRRLSDIQGTSDADAPGFLAFLIRCGFPEDAVAKFSGFAAVIQRINRSCPGLTGIDEGDVITGAGNRRIRVHARPGHSSSDLVYEVEGTGILLTGDHVLPHITPNPTLEAPEPEDDPPYRALPCHRDSLRKTAAMPCRVAAPGHGLPFLDLAGRCRTILTLQERRLRDVVRIVRDRGPLSVKDLSLALFGRVRMWDVYLTLSEVRGALDVLEADGTLVVDRSGPVDSVTIAG
jgi:glyoxylase-like metal-dependent hydrolase (beta-lactamase superfamily II)